ncbi:MAG: hypothetical protein C0456_13870, partial [Hyphomonas sp.]|uniref:ankyrin repeat domain-containing protein n=1 Tax=Hyphomonas sp. TaxID=87 RepID=UPI001DC8EA9C
MGNLSAQLGNMVRAAIEDHDQVFLACAVSLGIDCGATAATFAAAKSLSPALQATSKLLRPPLESNHLLLQLVHEVKWQALLDILAEIDRDPTPYSAKTPPLANLVDTADELSRQKIARRVDARDAERPGEPSRFEKCVTWLLTSISAKSPEIAAFSESDRLLVQQLDAALSREIQNQPGAHDAEAIRSDLFRLTSSIAAETLLLELDARVAGRKPVPFRQRVAEGPATESRNALAHFLARFDDPATGWIATYRYRLKQRLSDTQRTDEFQRILLNFTSEGLLQGREILTYSRLLQGLVEGMSDDFHKRFDDLSAHLTSILKALEASRLQLDPLGADKHSQSGDRFIDYVYSKQNTEFVGRGGEMEQLRAFLGADAPILWWQVSGDGGQGKSRIALELIQEAARNGWHAGFLKSGSIHDIPWTTLPINRPTLCVVDYVGAPEKAKAVATGLVTLLKRRSEAYADWNTGILQPFRLLIVERSPYATEDEAPPAMWYAPFCATGDNTSISGAMHAPLPLHLTPLSEEAMRHVIISWRKYRGKAEPAPEDLNRIIAALNKTAWDSTRRRAWRPLLAMLIADAILDGASGRDTTIGNALSFLLEDEQARSWSKIFPPDGFPTRPAARQAILATMLGQLDIPNADLDEAFYQPDDLETRKRAWTTLGYVVDPAASRAGRQAPLLARVPDLLGEYMIDWLEPSERECEQLCTDAWRLDAQSAFAFLVRLAEDRTDLGISKTFRRLASAIPIDMPPETARKIDLNAAAYYGLSGLAKKLLELGADPETTHGNGAFPLLFAAQNGHGDIVAALLDKGADPNRENQSNGTF